MSNHPNHYPTDFSIAKLLGHDNPKTVKPRQRRRSSFNAAQVHWLEAEFRCHRYVSPERRAALAALLDLTQQQIKIWFQNRRYKSKFRIPNGSINHPECAHYSQQYNQQNNQDLFKLLNRPQIWSAYGNHFMAKQTRSENKIPQIDYPINGQNRSN